MSATVNPDNILQTRGVQRGLDAYVVGAAFNHAGACAFGTGDGRILIVRKDIADWQEIAAHDGGVLSLATDLSGGWLSGGDDGRFLRIAADGQARTNLIATTAKLTASVEDGHHRF